MPEKLYRAIRVSNSLKILALGYALMDICPFAMQSRHH